MNILALDLATEFGFCGGIPPQDLSRLNHGAISLRHPPKPLADHVEDLVQLGFNLAAWLDAYLMWRESHPDLIVYEAPMDPGARRTDKEGKELFRNAKSSLVAWHLAIKAVEIAKQRQIRIVKVYPNTFRPRFIGSTGAGDRKTTKELMIRRCIEFGYLKPGSKNDNEADAIGLWHWAQCHYARWQPPVEFVLGTKLKVVGGTA